MSLCHGSAPSTLPPQAAGVWCEGVTDVRSSDHHRPALPALRIGFIDLIDAGPLIVAAEHGYFVDEGLHVVLERQLGWGNIRDRLTYGELDAAHALLGMPLFSRINRDW